MKIRLAGFVNDSIVDGPGLRFTVFAQGCGHNCAGCHNPHTHDYNAGKIYETDYIVEMVISNPLLDGVSFSGGEPLDQPEAFYELAEKLKNKSESLNIYCFTGYLFENLINSGDDNKIKLLSVIDVLIDGPFVLEKRNLGLKFRGSSNQRILDCKESVKHGRAIEKTM